MRACLIADDHVLMREALAGTVRLAWPAAHVTEVGDFPSAWAAAADRPEVAIVDLMMPGADPLTGIGRLRTASPDTAILVVTGTDDDRLLLALLDLGIAGFAPKTSNGGIIEAALRLIAAGGRYLPPRLAVIAAARGEGPAAGGGSSGIEQAGVESAGRETGARETGARETAAGLTDRQVDVLRLVAAGLSNKEVAQRLNISPATVKSHLAHAQIVLGAKNRTDAVVRAREQDRLG